MVFPVIVCARIFRYLRAHAFGFREIIFYSRCGAVRLDKYKNRSYARYPGTFGRSAQSIKRSGRSRARRCCFLAASNHRDGRTIRHKRFILKYRRRRRVVCDRIVLKIPTWPRSVACQLATMGCSHPPFFCCPIGAREKIGRDGEKTEKKKTIIRLPLMAPGSTRHAATTLRWLLSHGHRPRLSNKRTGVFLFLFDVRVFTTIPAHDCSTCGQRCPAPKALFEHAHNRTGPGLWKILICPSLGCYRPSDRRQAPSGTRAWRRAAHVFRAFKSTCDR